MRLLLSIGVYLRLSFVILLHPLLNILLFLCERTLQVVNDSYIISVMDV